MPFDWVGQATALVALTASVPWLVALMVPVVLLVSTTLATVRLRGAGYGRP